MNYDEFYRVHMKDIKNMKENAKFLGQGAAVHYAFMK